MTFIHGYAFVGETPREHVHADRVTHVIASNISESEPWHKSKGAILKHERGTIGKTMMKLLQESGAHLMCE